MMTDIAVGMAFTQAQGVRGNVRAAPFLIRYTILDAMVCNAGKDRRRLSLLLLIASVTLSFAFVIVVPSFARAHPTSTSSSTSCKQQEEDSIVMAKPTASGIPRWTQHEISATAPNRGCHLITHQITAAIKSDITNINILVW
jgi:hypothetical protein